MARGCSVHARLALLVGALLLAPAAAQAGPPPGRGHAPRPVVVAGGVGSYQLALHMDVLEDPGGELDIEKVSAAALAGRFKPNRKLIPNHGYSTSVFWVRFQLRAAEPLRGSYLVESHYAMMDHFTLFIPLPGGGFKARRAGDDQPFLGRDLRFRNFVFAIPTPGAAAQTYYLRCETEGSMRFPLKLWTYRAFVENALTRNYALGVYYGAFVVMFIFNLLLFLFLRDRAYLYYTLFIITYGVFQVMQNGVLLEIVAPGDAWWKFRAYIGLACVPMIFSLLFARTFLDTRANTPVLDRLLLGLMVAGGALGLWSLCTDALIPIRLRLLAFLVLSWALVNFTAGLISFLKGYRPARFYMLAWLCFLVGVAIFAVQSFGALPSNIFTLYSMQTGSVLILILLSIALPDKMLLIQKEKAEAQARALREETLAREAQQAMTEAFARFVPREFLEILEKQSIVEVELGDQVQKEMTILFSDIRSFTTLSEGMTPQENFNFINTYLGKIVPVVRQSGGFIDKFIGDAIMALFVGAPDRAIRASVELQEEVRSINRERREQGLEPISVGVGLHSGTLMLGTIGETQRMETTVISDAVNLASRMEGLTKIYGSGIIVSGAVLSEVGSGFAHRRLDLTRVKGKREAVEVHEILDGLPADLRQLRLATRDEMEAGIRLYHERHPGEALEHFQRVLREDPEDRAAALYVERCERLERDGVPEAWNPVEIMSTK